MTKIRFLKLLFGLIFLASIFWGKVAFKKINETEFEFSGYKSEYIEIEKIVSTRFKNSDKCYNQIHYSFHRGLGSISFGKTKLEKIRDIKSVDFDKDGKSARLTFLLKNDSIEVIEIDVKKKK